MSTITGDAGDNIITGGEGYDSLSGKAGDDLLSGLGGGDALDGGGGADTVIGGDGDDYLSGYRFGYEDSQPIGDLLDGGAGADVMWAGAGDTALGGDGDDQLDMFWTLSGQGGHFDGGAGEDSLSLIIETDDAITIDLSGLTRGGDQTIQGAAFTGFETGYVTFGYGDDVVDVGRNSERFSVSGGAGDDHLIGRGGDDVLDGGFGFDTLEGGAGDDVLSDSGGRYGDDLDGRQILRGGAGDDRVYSTSAAGTLLGGGGDDRVVGRGDLLGGDGVDTLEAVGSGNILKGGEGQDTYVFASLDRDVVNLDRISDATIAQVDLHGIDAVTKSRMNDAFTIVDAFDKHAGELTIGYSAANDQTRVEGDTDGDGKADLVILIDGDHSDPGLFVL